MEMSTAAIILKCFDRKPDDIDLASVDFPGISSERLSTTDADIWALHRASLLKVEDETVSLAGIPLGDVCDFPEIAQDPVYLAQKEKLSQSAARLSAHPDDIDILQEYVDNKENCAFLVLNALEMAHLRSGVEQMSDTLRQFKLGYMEVMQRLPEKFFDELIGFFSQANIRAAEELALAQYAEILLEQIEFFIENRQYQFSEPLFPLIEVLKDSMTDFQIGKLSYLHAVYLFHNLDMNAAASYYEESLKYLANVPPTWETRLIGGRSLLYLGIISMQKEQPEEAAVYYKAALNRMDVAPDDQYVYFMGEKSGIYHHLGYLYESTGMFDEAEKYYMYAMELREELGRYSMKMEGDYGITLGNMAFLYESTGRYQAADEAFRKSITIRKRLVSLSPREYLTDYARIMYSCLYVSRDREYATDDSDLNAICDEAIRVFRYFADNDTKAEWRQKLAWLLFDRGFSLYTMEDDFAKAESYMKESLDIRESFIAEDSKWIEQSANICYRLGDMFFMKTDYAQAKDYFRKALDYRRKSAPAYQIINTQNRKGECCILLGEYEQALELYFSSLNMLYAQEGTPEDDKIAYIKACIGETYFHMEEYVLARTFYTQAITLFTALNDACPEDETFADSIAACGSWLDDIDSHLVQSRPKSSYLS